LINKRASHDHAVVFNDCRENEVDDYNGKKYQTIQKNILSYPDYVFDFNGGAKLLGKINEFKKMVEKTEKDTDNEYWKLKEELGDQWGTIRSYEFTNHYKDNLASATCHILKSEPDILKLLSPTSKDRIEIIANIRFDHEGFCENARIANFCENCCEILELDMNEVKISQELIERYFDPKEDPYNFKSLFITC